MRCFACWVALVPILASPAIANPPCFSCAPRVRTIVKRVEVIKKVAVPVFVPSFGVQ
jgi:hypothetical protein